MHLCIYTDTSWLWFLIFLLYITLWPEAAVDLQNSVTNDLHALMNPTVGQSLLFCTVSCSQNLISWCKFLAMDHWVILRYLHFISIEKNACKPVICSQYYQHILLAWVGLMQILSLLTAPVKCALLNLLELSAPIMTVVSRFSPFEKCNKWYYAECLAQRTQTVAV